MKTFEIRKTTFVTRPLAETFAFFADARNLQHLTPPWIDFAVETPGKIVMGPGTLIDYRLRLHGLALRWRTHIPVWEPPHLFVDEQLAGPYKSWVHEHRFEEKDGGTLVHDHVTYALPLGPLGVLAQHLFVGRDVARIFAYREERLPELLR